MQTFLFRGVQSPKRAPEHTLIHNVWNLSLSELGKHWLYLISSSRGTNSVSPGFSLSASTWRADLSKLEFSCWEKPFLRVEKVQLSTRVGGEILHRKAYLGRCLQQGCLMQRSQYTRRAQQHGSYRGHKNWKLIVTASFVHYGLSFPGNVKPCVHRLPTLQFTDFRSRLEGKNLST